MTYAERLAVPMPASAKLVYLALFELGPGRHKIETVQAMIGLGRSKGHNDTIRGGKTLRKRGIVTHANHQDIIAGEDFAKPEPPAPRKRKAAKKEAK